ncbi:MAG: AI-2E family transporter [Acidiferrobacterales bacterium]
MSEMAQDGDTSIPLADQIASWVLMGLALIVVLAFHLLSALLAGLLVFQFVQILSSALRVPFITSRNTKIVVVAVLATASAALMVLGSVGIAVFLRKGPDNLAMLLSQLATIVANLKHFLPGEIASKLSSGTESLKVMIAEWLREHADEVRTLGTATLRIFAHVLIGLIVGAMVALHEAVPSNTPTPFVRALMKRVDFLAVTFRRIMLAQLPISAINTILTSAYLLVLLPSFGIRLPFLKTLIVITFVAGLVPVAGNLVSNTVIFLVSLSVSFAVAVASLVFLIVIHKLEYFLNAHIVGARINAKAWEILIAMLVFEAIFGLRGVIAAPIFYAYAKLELADQGLI